MTLHNTYLDTFSQVIVLILAVHVLYSKAKQEEQHEIGRKGKLCEYYLQNF
jgi:hypothetical protein